MSTCREKFNKLFRLARKCASLVGCDIFDPKYKKPALIYFVFTTIYLFFILSGYTIYVAIYIDHDWTDILKALCMVGSGVAGLCKLYNFTSNRPIFVRIFEEIDEVYKIYQEKSIKYQNALNDTTLITSKFLKLNAAVYVFVVVLITSVPLFYVMIFGEKILVMQFLIPKVDPTTEWGYWTLFAAHSLCIFFGAFGHFGGDMFFFIFLLQVPLYKNILRIKFEDLNDVSTDIGEPSAESKTVPMLNDILAWHQKYSALTQSLSEVNFAVLFVQIFTTTFSIGMTTFITFMGNWPAGYAYLIFSVVILYTFCGMGTVTEIANDNVCEYVYNSCLWYRLSIGERKMLLIMMMKAQNPTLLTVGDIMPLSVATALSLTKTIYSFLMMLLNFTEE